MSKIVLAVCDCNRMYCERLQEYLRSNLKLNFVICAFTDPDMMLDFSRKQKISLLVISESALCSISDEDIEAFRNVIVLEEELGDDGSFSKAMPAPKYLRHLSKYSPASEIVA